MSTTVLILIGVVIGAVFLFVGYKYGQEVGRDKGMEQLLSYIKVFDQSGQLIKGIQEMLVASGKLSMDEKKKVFDDYLKVHFKNGKWQ